MRKLLTLILILVTVCSYASMRGGAQYDPDAARSNLSNVDATATPSMTSITLSDKIRAVWADILGDIYASGTAKVATGTAAAPAYSFGSDPDTGIYSAGANSLGFNVGNNQAGYFTSAKNLVLNSRLVFDKSSYEGGYLGAIWRQEDVGNVYVGSGSTTLHYFTDGGGGLMMGIYNTGNVLIATSTDDGVNKLQVNGFSKFGEAATGVKMKVLTGTTAAAQAGATNIAHGMSDRTKIISRTVRVDAGLITVPPAMTDQSGSLGYEYYEYINDTNIVVVLDGNNSGNILAKPITAVIWYKE